MAYTYSYQSTHTVGVRVYDERLKKTGVIASVSYYDKVNYYERLYGSWPNKNFDKIEVTFDGEGSNTSYYGQTCHNLALESATAGAAYANLKLWYRCDETAPMTGVGDWVGENQGVAKPDDGVNPGPTHSATTPAIGAGSLVFNGTNQYMTGTTVGLPLDTLSFSFWAKTTATNGTMASFGGGDTNNMERAVKLSAGKVQVFEKKDAAETTLVSTNTIQDGKWHHIVVTIASTSGAWKIYVDSVDVTTGSQNGPGNSNLGVNTFTIGVSHLNSAKSNYFNGSLDDVRVYNSVLSGANIAELFAQKPPFTGTQTSAYSALLAWYRCEETSGATLSDNKGSHDMTLYNPTYYTHVSASVDQGDNSIEFSRSSNNKAYDSTALNHGMSRLTPLGSLNGDAYSVSMWVKFTQTSYHATMWQFNHPTHNATMHRMTYIVDGGGYWLYQIYYKETSGSTGYSDSFETTAGAVNYHDNNWHHLVITKSGNTVSDTIEMYIDNALAKSASLTNTGGKVWGFDSLTFGAGWHNNKWNWISKAMTTDDYRVYNRKLTASEVSELYATK